LNETEGEGSCNDTCDREDPKIPECQKKDVEYNVAAIISRISALAAIAPPTQQIRQHD